MQYDKKSVIIDGAAVEYYKKSRVGLLSYIVLRDEFEDVVCLDIYTKKHCHASKIWLICMALHFKRKTICSLNQQHYYKQAVFV